MAEDAPQFSLTRTEQDAFAMRRRAAAAVRTEFRAIMPAGRAAARVSVARDGRGNSAEVARDTGNVQRRKSFAASPDIMRADELAARAGAMHEGRAVVDYDELARQLAAEEAERERTGLPS